MQQGECEVGISTWTRKQDSVTFGKEGADVEFAVNEIPGAERCQESLMVTESIEGEWSSVNLERSSDCTGGNSSLPLIVRGEVKSNRSGRIELSG
jgi:hypothetical protein